jgi:hypothetical protein
MARLVQVESPRGGIAPAPLQYRLASAVEAYTYPETEHYDERTLFQPSTATPGGMRGIPIGMDGGGMVFPRGFVDPRHMGTPPAVALHDGHFSHTSSDEFTGGPSMASLGPYGIPAGYVLVPVTETIPRHAAHGPIYSIPPRKSPGGTIVHERGYMQLMPADAVPDSVPRDMIVKPKMTPAGAPTGGPGTRSTPSSEKRKSVESGDTKDIYDETHESSAEDERVKLIRGMAPKAEAVFSQSEADEARDAVVDMGDA